MNCPGCGETKIHRSRRRGALEKAVLNLVAVFPFRCSACGKRFLRFRPSTLVPAIASWRRLPVAVRFGIWILVLAVVGTTIILLVVSF